MPGKNKNLNKTGRAKRKVSRSEAKKRPLKRSARPARAYHHGALREELLRAALRAIEERGFVEFNLRELAEACGVSAAAVYRHFASKNQLLVALAGRGFESLSAEFDRILADPSAKPLVKLDRLALAYVKFAMENEGLFRVMFSRELCGFAEYKAIEPVASRTFKSLNEALGQVGRGAKSRADRCAEDAEVLRAWALVHGLSFLWIDRNVELTEKNFRKAIGAIFLHA